jgi:hypothetical protein
VHWCWALHHRRARLVLPFQTIFKICSCLISNSSKNQKLIQTTYQFSNYFGFIHYLNPASPLNLVKPIKICSIKSSIVKLSSSENQARLLIHISFQGRLSIFFFIPSKNKARRQLLMKARSRSREEF